MVGFCKGNHFYSTRNTMFSVLTCTHAQVWTVLHRGAQPLVDKIENKIVSNRTCMILSEMQFAKPFTGFLK